MSELVRVIEVASELSVSEVSIPSTVSTSDVALSTDVSKTEVEVAAATDATDATVTITIMAPSVENADNKFLAYSGGKVAWVDLDSLITAYFSDHNLSHLLTLNEVEST